MDRRTFMKLAGLGAAGILADGCGLPNGLSAAVAARIDNPVADPDLEVELTAIWDEVPIFAGRPTTVWRYKGRVLHGDANALQTLNDSYLGPVFRVKTGQRVRIILKNDIPDHTIIHWHGLHVPDNMDGHPRFIIPRGSEYVYDFEIRNRAGMYWYHPHPHGRTGPQVYGGLAGIFIVSDDEESSAGLPSGEYEMPMVIQDRLADEENQLIYLTGGADRIQGFLGDRILVNGKPDYVLNAVRSAYRLRILNGSNSRIYRIAWSDGSPLTIIGTDGGLLESPIQQPQMFLGTGERLDIYKDFSEYPSGDGPSLVSTSFYAGAFGGGMMGRGMMGGGANVLPNGAPLTIFRVRLKWDRVPGRSLPRRLSTPGYEHPEIAINFGAPKPFFLTMNMMSPSINGRVFQMTDVADDEIVGLNTREIWEFVNQGGMGVMMNMPHPMHLHGMQFQVLGRSGAGLADGFMDVGWKDTTVVMPGQRVRILARFDHYPGLYLYHCHNLEHEDMGMMRNYLVAGKAQRWLQMM